MHLRQSLGEKEYLFLYVKIFRKTKLKPIKVLL